MRMLSGSWQLVAGSLLLAAPIAARLRADYEASPASANPGALIAEFEATASMKALNITLIGLTEDLPPPVRD